MFKGLLNLAKDAGFNTLTRPNPVFSRGMALVVNAPKVPIKLHTISDNAGATKERKRLGRGRASGHGKTCGFGQKGQKARAGNSKPRLGFEGGQTPMKKRVPKRGFTNVHAYDLVPLRLNRVQRWIDLGRLDASKPITMKELIDSKCIHKIKDGVNLLGDGSDYLTSTVDIEVTKATKNAIFAIENLSGKLTTRYYNMLGLRALLRPEKFVKIPKFASPVRKKDIDYYMNPDNRGYLSLKKSTEES